MQRTHHTHSHCRGVITGHAHMSHHVHVRGAISSHAGLCRAAPWLSVRGGDNLCMDMRTNRSPWVRFHSGQSLRRAQQGEAAVVEAAEERGAIGARDDAHHLAVVDVDRLYECRGRLARRTGRRGLVKGRDVP